MTILMTQLINLNTWLTQNEEHRYPHANDKTKLKKYTVYNHLAYMIYTKKNESREICIQKNENIIANDMDKKKRTNC